jgi:hypothetical protein
MSDIFLGYICENDGQELRDATHVAVYKAQAAHILGRGDYVEVCEGLAYLSNRANSIGIVDPFLKDPVKRGEFFLVVLFPGSTKNLRHHWSHPSLPEKESVSDTLYQEDDYVGCAC